MRKVYLYPSLVVIGACSYGIVSTIIKLAMRGGFSASQAVTSQFVFGFTIAVCIFVIQKKKLNVRDLKNIIPAGILTGLTNISYGLSLNYLPASLAVVLLFQFTWIGMLISCIAKRQFPRRIEYISLSLLFVGTISAAGLVGVDLSTIAIQGWLWGLVAALCYSLFLFFNGRSNAKMTTSNRLVLVSFFAFITTVVFQSPQIIWDGTLFGEGLWIYGLALGLFGMVVPVFLFSIAIPKVGLGTSSILSAVELPIAMFVSVMLLNETVSVPQMMGVLIIIVGMCAPTLSQNILLGKSKKNVVHEV
ncbi:DMT family transporter [Halobacillus shinanisalinarum]|uniref:DMT family transporter n=1 Tax=Halobacillus shinanisalinarum TaxID=2932258 RepID=A0ABY4GXG5_9BACI|nr:DMT family transporter [Halobacillus shinanisalinarum]UOQ92877.1 DMT family transporter [Halobacillus shinanisalinarum]